MTVIIRARESFYLKRTLIPIKVQEALDAKYTHRFYEERACKKCDYYEERMEADQKHLEICDTCAAYKGGAKLYQEVKLKGTSYISTPIGDRAGLIKALRSAGIEYKFRYLHPETKFKRPIRFTGTLKPFQREAVDVIHEKKRGVIKAPPRTGKTVLATAAICEIGLKAMVLASQMEWLLGFKETFVGSKTQKPLTNCKPTQIGVARTYEDFLKYDVCLVTVQTFRSAKGQRLLRRIRHMIPVCVVDEVHTSAAPRYADVISKMNVEYLIGLSGTPTRKDQRHSIMRDLVGQNIYEAKVERLRPTIKLVRTEYTKNYKGNVLWTTMVSSLERNPQRLKLIAQWALKDVANGHMILIPFAQIVPIKALVMAINRMAGEQIARPFYGGTGKSNRDRYIQAARRYKIKVLVGNIKLLSQGTNIPRASAIYEVTMSANRENAEQRISRILTPWKKPPPVVRMFLDEMNVRKRCMAQEWYQVMLPKFRPLILDRDREVMKGYLSSKPANYGKVEL